ncbi:MAG: S8 family serine peptidase [Alphaproteobacteria bacterium]
MSNDPLFSIQWYLKNTGQTGGTPGVDVNIEPVWQDYTGQGVEVLIIDSGVDYLHSDIGNSYDTAADLSYFLPTGDAYPSDGAWHGTFVAGLIGADANNGTGIAGVAYDSELSAARLTFSGRAPSTKPTTHCATAPVSMSPTTAGDFRWGCSTASSTPAWSPISTACAMPPNTVAADSAPSTSSPPETTIRAAETPTSTPFSPASTR